MAVIACVDLDPFLVGIVRRVRPDDRVVELEAGGLGLQRRVRYAAFVMPARTAREAGLQGSGVAERTVLVAGEGEGVVPATHPGPVVRRPVEAADLRQALARVVPASRLARLRRRFHVVPVGTSTDGLFSLVRVAAVAGAAGLAMTGEIAGPPGALIASVLAWTLLRVWVRRSTIGLVLADGVAGGAVVLAGSGANSPFLLFAAVVAAEVGYTFPPRAGALLVGMVTLGGLVPLSLDMRQGQATSSDLIGWGALIPLASIVGVLVYRVRAGERRDNLQTLQELHATLDRLSKQAQGVAGTLDVRSVVEQAMETARDDLDASAGVLLLGDGDVLSVADSFGLSGAPPPRVVTIPSRRGPAVPAELVAVLPPGEQHVTALDAMGVRHGILVVVTGDGVDRAAFRAGLATLASELAAAMDNARLFESIQELTIDEERRRLARDLHDGVIQSLVHVRFELDLVRRLVDSEQTGEIERLRDVVGQAVDEVRATVNDLRSVRLSAGLGTALLSVAREYERPELRVVVDAGPVEHLTPEAELQLLRIAQEAISNAVHHGRSSLVYVRLWEDREAVHLQVLDDGVGIEVATSDPARGVGLRAMEERAGLLGATLDLGPGADGGTCVQVDVPLERVAT